jgi:hypothetical protein
MSIIAFVKKLLQCITVQIFSPEGLCEQRPLGTEDSRFWTLSRDWRNSSIQAR